MKRILFTLFCLALAALPVSADWLVLHTGERLETKGDWEVRGRQVRFTSPTGHLESIALTEVDLDASRAANLPPPAAAIAPAPQPAKPALPHAIRDLSSLEPENSLVVETQLLAGLYDDFPFLGEARAKAATIHSEPVVAQFERDNSTIESPLYADCRNKELSNGQFDRRCIAAALALGFEQMTSPEGDDTSMDEVEPSDVPPASNADPTSPPPTR
jgi:hypothetical protein